MNKSIMFSKLQWRKILTVLVIINVLVTQMISTCQGEVITLQLHRTRQKSIGLPRQRREVGGNKNLFGQSGEGYYLEIQIGTPAQKLNVLLDTGSSNFAIAAATDSQISKFFWTKNSSTYEDSGTSVYVPYTQGDWKGELGSDLVHLNSLPNVTVRAQIAFITSSSDFFLNTSDWQGIVGFAYQQISRPDGNVVPYFDSLVKEGHINNIFSMLLCGAQALPNSHQLNSSDGSMDGTLILGGVTRSLYTGQVFYTPIHREWYYEVVISDVQVNDISLKMDCKEYNFDKTIVDSGTTNLRFPDKVFQTLVKNIQDHLMFTEEIPLDAFWLGVEVMCWKKLETPYTGFPNVSVSLVQSNHTYFKLTLLPQQYLRPVQDPTDPDLEGYCFKFGISTSSAGTVLGAVLMEGFYVIFDRANKKVGFAETTCAPRYPVLSTMDTHILGPFNHTGNDLFQCAYKKPEKDTGTLMVVAYVMIGVCIVCVMPLLIMVVQYQVKKCRGRPSSDTSSDTGNLINR